jgi:hypothetical protein
MKTFVKYAGPGAISASMMHCSFCHRTRDEVSKLVAGPAGVFICDECVQVCVDILERERQLPRKTPSGPETSRRHARH